MLPRILQSSTSLRLSLLLTALAAAPAQAGPPWISVEYPANPFDRATRGALLIVHTYHHGASTHFPIVGVAEGVVNGRRQRVQLEVTPTSRTGVWAIKGELPKGGAWVVSATMTESGATALAALGSDGELAAVQVPHDRRDGWIIPRRATAADVDALLRTAMAATEARQAAGLDGQSALPPGRALLAGLGALALFPFGALVLLRRPRRTALQGARGETGCARSEA